MKWRHRVTKGGDNSRVSSGKENVVICFHILSLLIIRGENERKKKSNAVHKRTKRMTAGKGGGQERTRESSKTYFKAEKERKGGYPNSRDVRRRERGEHGTTRTVSTLND